MYDGCALTSEKMVIVACFIFGGTPVVDNPEFCGLLKKRN